MNALSPSRENLLHPFEEAFNSIFDEFFTIGKNSVRSRKDYPKVDIFTDKNTWNVEVAVPGMKSEDINIEIVPSGKESYLKISGKMVKVQEDAFFSVKELRRSFFERMILLPNNVEGEPEATMQDGLLKLTWQLPKLEQPEKRKINIKK